MIRLHRKGSERRFRKRVPAKKRNNRALMLARQRRHIRVGGIAEHYPKKKYALKTTCSECGVKMSYDRDLKKYIIG